MSKRRSSPAPTAAKGTPAPKAPDKKPMNRFAQLGLGLALGALWGVVMCLILLSVGRIDSGADWAYRIATSALIGLAVATVFGTVTAARRGESLGSARFWRRSR